MGLHFVVPFQPCLGLYQRVVVEIFTVGHLDPTVPQFTKHIVSQFVDGIRHKDGGHLLLHGVQLGQRDRGIYRSITAVLLALEDGQTLIAVSNILCHHFDLQTVIQWREDLFLWIGKVGYLVGRGKEGNCRNGIGTPLVGILSFVESCQQGVQHAIIGLEYLIQEYDIRLRYFSGGLYHRFILMQRGHGLSVAEQLICRLFQHGKAVRRIFPRTETIHHTLKIKA